MKSPSILLLAAAALVTAAHGQQTNARPPMRKAPTNEELVLQLRKSENEMAESVKSRTLSSTVNPNANAQPRDLISMSDILCYNGALTLVPKRAILAYPKNLEDRLKPTPGVRVQTWGEFYAANRGWITTVEVSKIEAQGKQALPKETSAHITKCGNLVVATYRGNPISVLPLSVPEAETQGEASTTPVSKTNTPNQP